MNAILDKYPVLIYLIPLSVVLIGGWTGQIRNSDYQSVDSSKTLSYLAFFPFINIILAVFVLIWWAIWLAIQIAELPSTIRKNLAQKKRLKPKE